jgi:hypothetical protein
MIYNKEMNKNIVIAILLIIIAWLSYNSFLNKKTDIDDTVKGPGIVYNNVKPENIVVDLPFPGAVTGKEFKAIGKAKGFMFEASFPVEVLDKDGQRLFIGPAHATVEDWMVDALVPFEIDIKVPETYIGPATIIFRKDNASGLPEHEGSASFPIVIEY